MDINMTKSARRYPVTIDTKWFLALANCNGTKAVYKKNAWIDWWPVIVKKLNVQPIPVTALLMQLMHKALKISMPEGPCIDGDKKAKGSVIAWLIFSVICFMSKFMPLFLVMPKALARCWKELSVNSLHSKLSQALLATVEQRLTSRLKNWVWAYIFQKKIEGKGAILPKRMGSRAYFFLARQLSSFIQRPRNTYSHCRKYYSNCYAENNTCKMRLMFCQTASYNSSWFIGKQFC